MSVATKSKKAQTPRTQTQSKTTFSCHAPDAERVCVTGDFNEWSLDATPMKKNRQGKWTAKVDLPAGRHEYKFVVDGEWCCEPGCDGPHLGFLHCVANVHGTMNRVIEVE